MPVIGQPTREHVLDLPGPKWCVHTSVAFFDHSYVTWYIYLAYAYLLVAKFPGTWDEESIPDNCP